MKALILVGFMSLVPTVASAQAIEWKLVSTTGGLIVAPAHPAVGNDRYFDRQRQRFAPPPTSLAVRPFTLDRRLGATGSPVPLVLAVAR